MSDDTLTTEQAADQAARIVGELAREPDGPLEVQTDPERSRDLVSPQFSRMRTEWTSEDLPQARGVTSLAEGTMHRLFPDVYLMLNELYSEVRKPLRDPDTGFELTDAYGWPQWERTPSGAYVEDYTRLTMRSREEFLLRIATMSIEWGQRSMQMWLDAMLAKVRWEEAMAEGFTAPTGRLTVEERTQRGRAEAIEHRYHAVFRTALSRAAENLVNDVKQLGQRIKDATAL